MSFVDALEQIPSYVKFLKYIFTKKRRMNEYETVTLTQATSNIFKNMVQKKMTYPRSFTVSCSIDDMDLGHTLCNLGASINLMHLSIFKKLGMWEAQPTKMVLQFVDRSITRPEGKIDDVLIKVDKFLFLADFIILDYEADREVPIILELSFLRTGHALIDVHQWELTMLLNDQKISFNIVNAMNSPLMLKTAMQLNLLGGILARNKC
ncbi:uncharacterized protein LOC103495890 [Cucumis melo]|uniref:Uncharacterized protein LOC103495890 n=1 Tax=Cucumis melo TaxID=3656 RepID=A0A1S3C2F1_CUCME|nr:uncharacterized protein LOC103495890 [Cucumis melo]